MKTTALCVFVMGLAASCNLQKPYSPLDDPGAKQESTKAESFTINEQFNADIGDVEHHVFVEGRILPESITDSVTIEEREDARGRLLLNKVTLTPPLPESLWALYEVKCGRQFTVSPAVLRARVMVDGKPAGSFSALLGKTAMKNGVTAKVDLLRPLEELPESFFVDVEGELFLMPVGTDETKVNPDTATSPISSKALQRTSMRVFVEWEPPPAERAAAAPHPESARARESTAGS